MGGILIPERDAYGNIVQPINKFSEIGWNYHKQGISFETSQLNSLYNKDDKGSDLSFATLKCYNDLLETTESSNQADADLNCVKTVILWEPTFDYELVQGSFHQGSVPSNNIYMYCIGVPQVAAPAGSKEFICCLNLKLIPALNGFVADGRRPKRLNYNATYHTNEMKLILNHDAGYKHKASIAFEMYRA